MHEGINQQSTLALCGQYAELGISIDRMRQAVNLISNIDGCFQAIAMLQPNIGRAERMRRAIENELCARGLALRHVVG